MYENGSLVLLVESFLLIARSMKDAKIALLASCTGSVITRKQKMHTIAEGKVNEQSIQAIDCYHLKLRCVYPTAKALPCCAGYVILIGFNIR